VEKTVAQFLTQYRQYIRNTRKSDTHFGFDLRGLAKIEPILRFLFNDWWRVQMKGLDSLPEKGPALIVGHCTGMIPWPALMLMYAMMLHKKPRRLYIVADMDWIDDERLYNFATQIGFVPWSSVNIKHLFRQGELVAIFPEGLQCMQKPFSERYRLREFDWTRILPAVEEGIKIYPLAALGCDESIPVFLNVDYLAKLLRLPSFPVTPFFPWYPFPMNFFSLPVHWKMSIMKNCPYKVDSNRDRIEETTKEQARFVEGEIQAELNRLLRTRVKAIF